MTDLTITTGDPRDPQATALLEASQMLMRSLFSPEDNHYLPIDALCAPHIRFFVARKGDRLLGCAALADMGGYGEIKSMFVDPETRGQGVGDRLLEQLEYEAREQGLPELRLETGNALHEAIRLYRRHGFTECEPFGDYEANATSVFMQRALG
ncbi:putative acetyltransferase [Salinihabitans flavidus]|uniref:Putative acetyltransferase n=1 Tax=Salinihabitans flavidus TaxID=569882 RepID=A0A1H8VIB5_9RHOB|nr:GNAT family N-acetyltransferase [Salinihabitans flavidus]SEP14957.1 putative acetyltransferase [Salinihabitans flavidus]